MASHALCRKRVRSLILKKLIILCSNYDLEIIIVDDNSPDGTQEVVKELQRIYGDNKI
jgi:glycosyltransferase involved in cell wall biosynthesis